ncbi:MULTISPECIES: GNAT family N-acetyltransferase [Microbacterium]|uniref:GNAT family N-acetyltransferase n=1 Tax=Microbacterium TaxID=33882 RepID=UPI00277DB973|nr:MULTISPECIES: GNAT family N-acetyltransferase [Microbacterium]MDQ1082892.1 GNAT superfamily N-acetyltransferase [Microbacterium sp. SORGH_AS_0344]MDQ1168339.1 GNAT superfamily N-acetyltransferase [Microbacterium proteolyticum]
MTSLLVRRATPEDSRCIAHVYVRSWNETLAGLVPDAVSDLLDLELSAWRWSVRLRGGTPPDAEQLGDTWVGVRADRIIGFSSAGPSRDTDHSTSVLEVYALYVLAAHHGTGVGEALLRAAIGAEAACLWVLMNNPRAHAFYAKQGFAPDGATRVDERWETPICEVRLARGRDRRRTGA